MPYPVSVCVPVGREELFDLLVRPRLEACTPAEILAIQGPGGANVKRNRAARIATQPYLFFCDDDVLLDRRALGWLVPIAEQTDADVVYGDYIYSGHPTKCTGIHKARAFDLATLWRCNYISTMSLVRRSVFPGFDEALDRLQDWDLWLTMAKQKARFVYLPQTLFIALYTNDGITAAAGYGAAVATVRRKHGLRT